jgi:ABC-type bacteriocin/lantibiotic exporter with double-glycine peptidase domain
MSLRDLVAFLLNDWRTLVIDVLLGLIVLGIVCAWNWKFALVVFAVVSYVAGGVIVTTFALLIGVTIKEKINAWLDANRRSKP